MMCIVCTRNDRCSVSFKRFTITFTEFTNDYDEVLRLREPFRPGLDSHFRSRHYRRRYHSVFAAVVVPVPGFALVFQHSPRMYSYTGSAFVVHSCHEKSASPR